MQSGCEDTLEERYAIKLCFKLGKNVTETYGMLQTAFKPSFMNRASVFVWHKRFKEGRESERDDEICGMSKAIRTPELIGQRFRVRVTMLRFQGSSERDSVERGQHSSNRVVGFHQDNTPVNNSILVTEYLTKMGIRTTPQPPYSADFALFAFCLFPKLRGCRYETIVEMKEAVRMVIDTFTQENSRGAIQKLL